MYVFGTDMTSRGGFHAFNLYSKGGRGARLVLPGAKESRSAPSRRPRPPLGGRLRDSRRGVIRIPDSRSVPAATPAATPGTIPGPAVTGTSDPFIVTDVSLSQAEQIQVVKCFSERSYVYAFGHDPSGSNASITFACCLVASDCASWSKAIDHALASYRKSRVYANPEYAKIYFAADTPATGFIVGMSSRTLDQAFNIQSVTFNLIVPEVL